MFEGLRARVMLGMAAALAMAGTAGASPVNIAMHWSGYLGSDNTVSGATDVTGTDGVVPNSHWNNVVGGWYSVPKGGNANLVDSDGNPTTCSAGAPTNFTFWWVENGNTEPLLNEPWGGDGGQGGDGKVCNTPITGIPYASYDIIFYVNQALWQGATSTWRAWASGDPSKIYYFTPTLNTTANFVEITNTDPNQHQLGNYVVFHGLSGGSQTLNVSADPIGAFTNLGTGGFQIVPVPEPGSLSLLGAGALLAIRRRRR